MSFNCTPLDNGTFGYPASYTEVDMTNSIVDSTSWHLSTTLGISLGIGTMMFLPCIWHGFWIACQGIQEDIDRKEIVEEYCENWLCSFNCCWFAISIFCFWFFLALYDPIETANTFEEIDCTLCHYAGIIAANVYTKADEKKKADKSTVSCEGKSQCDHWLVGNIMYSIDTPFDENNPEYIVQTCSTSSCWDMTFDESTAYVEELDKLKKIKCFYDKSDKKHIIFGPQLDNPPVRGNIIGLSATMFVFFFIFWPTMMFCASKG